MKSELIVYTSYVSEENLEIIVKELNLLPVFILRSIRNSELIGKYSGSAIHFRNLAPTSPLYQAYRDGLIDFTEYTKRYLIELSDIKMYEVIGKLESLCNVSEAEGIVLLGYGEDLSTSHRKILSDFINSSGLLEKQITELTYETTNRDKNTGGSYT